MLVVALFVIALNWKQLRSIDKSMAKLTTVCSALLYAAVLCSVVSSSLWPPGLEPARLLCPWNFPGKDTGVSFHSFLQGIFPTQGSNPSLASTVQAGRFFSTDPPGKPCSVLLLLLLSCFSRVRLCATPQTVAHQAPPSVGLAWALEWVAVSFSSAWKWKVKVKSLSCVRLLVTPWTAAYQAPPSMGFPRQEYWSGLPLPSPCSVLLSNKKEPSNDTCRNLDGLYWMEKPVPKGWISYDSMYIKMENRLLISRS